MKHLIAVIVVVGAAAGCRDSGDMIARDCRNTNNEVIDALMMVTSEARAEIAVDRVLKSYEGRLTSIADRVKNWKQNTETEEMAVQLFGNESAALLVVECQLNQRRLDRERKRIATVLDYLAAQERKVRKDVDEKQTWPKMYALTQPANECYKSFAMQLTDKNALLQAIDEMVKNARQRKEREKADSKDQKPPVYTLAETLLLVTYDTKVKAWQEEYKDLLK